MVKKVRSDRTLSQRPPAFGAAGFSVPAFGAAGFSVLGLLIFVNVISLLKSKQFLGTIQQYTGMNSTTLSAHIFRTSASSSETETNEEEQALQELHREDDENEGFLMSSVFKSRQKTVPGNTTKRTSPLPGTEKNYVDTLSDFDLETAVVILTNLCPSHPSLEMLQETMESLEHLRGLSPNAPIYIMVDHLDVLVAAAVTEEIIEKEKRLEQYVHNLYAEYEHNSNIHIVVNVMNKHIGGSTQKALQLLHPRTRYIHLVQHDFKFITDINHTAIVKTMDEERPGGNPIPMVRFNKRHSVAGCGNLTRLDVNGITLEPSTTWSDNNHVAKVEYYKELLNKLVFLKRPPEGPMQVQANANCALNAQWLYGANGHQYAIEHLDGRLGYVAKHDRETAANGVLAGNERRRLKQATTNSLSHASSAPRKRR